jgi:GxxExxY protein
MTIPAELNAITEQIIGAAMEVHRALGPGLLESAYATCLQHELALRGLAFKKEVDLPITYKGIKLDCGYRLDLIVMDQVIVEIKSVQLVTPIHEAQLLTYLRLTGFRVGLLLNFNVDVLRNGITRRIL